MTSPARLAAAQTVPVPCDIDQNVRQHLQLVDTAAAEGVSLLVFPELSLTGYELAGSAKLAFEPDDARLGLLVEAARRHEMTLVVGAPLHSSSVLNIAAFVIDPAASVHVYTKQHLGAFRPQDHPQGVVPPPESTFFAPGVLNPRFAWSDREVAVSICADSAYPIHAQTAANRGAEIYLSCQFAIPSHMAFKVGRLKEAARQHRFTVAFSNYGGPTGGLASAGSSFVQSPQGEAVALLPARGCGLAIAWDNGTHWTGKTVLV